MSAASDCAQLRAQRRAWRHDETRFFTIGRTMSRAAGPPRQGPPSLRRASPGRVTCSAAQMTVRGPPCAPGRARARLVSRDRWVPQAHLGARRAASPPPTPSAALCVSARGGTGSLRCLRALNAAVPTPALPHWCSRPPARRRLSRRSCAAAAQTAGRGWSARRLPRRRARARLRRTTSASRWPVCRTTSRNGFARMTTTEMASSASPRSCATAPSLRRLAARFETIAA